MVEKGDRQKKVTDEHVPPNLPFRCLDLDIVIVIHVFQLYMYEWSAGWPRVLSRPQRTDSCLA